MQSYVDLYVRAGEALQAARKADETAAESLFPRYRLVNVSAGIRDSTKRATDTAELEKILAAAKKIAP